MTAYYRVQSHLPLELKGGEEVVVSPAAAKSPSGIGVELGMRSALCAGLQD